MKKTKKMQPGGMEHRAGSMGHGAWGKSAVFRPHDCTTARPSDLRPSDLN